MDKREPAAVIITRLAAELVLTACRCRVARSPGLLSIQCSLLLSLCAACLVAEASAADKPEPVYIAVSSSLRFAWQPWIDKAQALAEKMDTSFIRPDVRVTFGASGNLSRQIIQGAPFTLFVSANEVYVDRVVKRSQQLSEKRFVAAGKLAWVSRSKAIQGYAPLLFDSSAALSAENKSLQLFVPVPGGKMPTKNITRLVLSIANPGHAPYGEAAMSLLNSYGLEKQDFSSVLEGENAAQALHFLKSGGADIALAPVSLLHSHDDEFDWVVADTTRYKPVAHHLLLLSASSKSSASKELFDQLLSANALRVLEEFGLQAGDQF